VSRAKDVVEVVARALVDHPDAVVVTESERRDGARVALSTEPGDLGKLIGRQGRTAAAIRALASAAADRDDMRVTVDFLDAPK
jgi:predicted RNA-binding protein YlqC (UPF0109 family)